MTVSFCNCVLLRTMSNTKSSRPGYSIFRISVKVCLEFLFSVIFILNSLDWRVFFKFIFSFWDSNNTFPENGQKFVFKLHLGKSLNPGLKESTRYPEILFQLLTVCCFARKSCTSKKKMKILQLLIFFLPCVWQNSTQILLKMV